MMRRLALGLLPLVVLQAGADRFCFEAAGAGPLSELAGTALPRCDDSPRQKVPTPRINPQIQVASATRSPWIVANGWRFLRNPQSRYLYELPAGKAALALAEAFTYDADAGFRFAAQDLEEAARMLAFLRQVPRRDLPPLADFAFVDDGSGLRGEAINLLTRRNLLYAIVDHPDSRYSLNVEVGSSAFPDELAANPGELAAAVRSQLTDERRSLRLYGTEMAIVRATGDGKAARLHILNYSDRQLTGIRLRIRGVYRAVDLHVFGHPDATATEFLAESGFTEFSIPTMGPYAVAHLQ